MVASKSRHNKIPTFPKKNMTICRVAKRSLILMCLLMFYAKKLLIESSYLTITTLSANMSELLSINMPIAKWKTNVHLSKLIVYFMVVSSQFLGV